MVLFAAALAVRVAYVLTLGGEYRWPDEVEYHGIALNLLQGKGYSYFRGADSALSPTAYRSPGMPVFLSLVYTLFGPSLLAARLAQAIFGAAIIPIVFFVTRELGYSRGAALLACLVAAFYPYYVFCAGAIYPVVTTTLLLVLANLALLKGRYSTRATWELLAGFLTGLTVLTFGHVLAAVPLVLVWIVVNKQSGRRRALISCLTFLVVCALTLSPWVIRNAIVMGRPIISTAFEYNFCMGNAPGAKWDSGSRISCLESPSLKKTTAKLGESEASRLYLDTGLQQVRANPKRFVILALGKAVNFWRFYPKPAARPVSTAEKLVGLLTYGPVLLISCIWLVADRARLRTTFLLIGYPVAAMLVSALTVSVDRYRLPFDIYLIVLASAAVATWSEKRKFHSA